MTNNEAIGISAFIERNARLEAKTIEEYSCFLKTLNESNLPDRAKTLVGNTISEIISDELNHQQKLQEIYVYLTDIRPNKD